MKLNRASILIAAILRWACFHAHAVTITLTHVSGGNCGAISNWNQNRAFRSSSNGAFAAADFCSFTRDSSLASTANARHPITIRSGRAAKRHNLATVVTDADRADAMALRVELNAGTGCSPPIPGVTEGSTTFAFDCDALIGKNNQMQSGPRPAQSDWNNLDGIISGTKAALSVTASPISDSQRSPLVL
ncbi:MAG: hypothetical protein KGJ60_12510 [Verrucomicrobiota bacterium]|nr:hypothetical protein [Verrucomicrobiota bacterium]